VALAQALLLVFQYCRLRWVSGKVTVELAPGARLTRLKPSSWRGGCPADAVNPSFRT
jgi:hypothetical protein